MEHIAAILLIIGCSNDLSQCRELPAPVTIFETAEACADARPFTLDDMVGQQPRIFGKCVSVDPALEEEDGEIVWNVTAAGQLEASVRKPSVETPDESPALLVASAQTLAEKDYLSQD